MGAALESENVRNTTDLYGIYDITYFLAAIYDSFACRTSQQLQRWFNVPSAIGATFSDRYDPAFASVILRL